MLGSSDLHAAGPKVGQHHIDALLVDQAQAGVGQPQRNPAVLAFDPELAALQVRHEQPVGLVVRVRNVMTGHRTLAGHLAYFRHGLAPGSLLWTANDYTLLGNPAQSEAHGAGLEVAGAWATGVCVCSAGI